jgi:hypothetical protein
MYGILDFSSARAKSFLPEAKKDTERIESYG